MGGLGNKAGKQIQHICMSIQTRKLSENDVKLGRVGGSLRAPPIPGIKSLNEDGLRFQKYYAGRSLTPCW